MSIIARAEHSVKNAIMGQPLHRDNLGEENTSNGTLRGVSPVSLQLAPQLQRELTQELQNAPKPTPTLTAAPKMGPGGNSMQTPNLHNRAPKPPTDNSGQKE